MHRARWAVLLLGVVSLVLAACAPGATIGRIPEEVRSHLPFSGGGDAPDRAVPGRATPEAATPGRAGSDDAAPGAAIPDAATSAVQLVIHRANFAQEQALTARDPSGMRETATESYYREMVQINRRLVTGGVTRIHLDALEWGPIMVDGNAATATAFETWTTTFRNGTTDQSRERNIYDLVKENGTWRIQANEHPDEGAPLDPRLTPVQVSAPRSRQPALGVAVMRLSVDHLQGSACDAAVTATGTRWDGLPLEQYTWGDFTLDVESLDGMPVTVCIASGPLERLPAVQAIGCLLVGGEVARIDGLLACGAFQSFQREGADLLYWVQHNSAATSFVTPLWWNGTELQRGEPFMACGGQLTPTPDEVSCFAR